MATSNQQPSLTQMQMSAITIDYAMQSRVKMSPDHSRRIMEAILDGSSFKSSPVSVFEVGPGEYVLADGFHRFEGHSKAGRTSIWAHLYRGSRSDAVIFSASANLSNTGLTITDDDKRKGARMLMEDPELWEYSDRHLGNMCGLTSGAFRRARKDYCAETGKEIPKMVKASTGKTYSRPQPGDFDGKTIGRPNVTGQYTACFNGKGVRLGSTKEDAERCLVGIVSDESQKKAKFRDASGFGTWLFSSGVIALTKPPIVACLRFKGLIVPGALIYIEGEPSPEKLAAAVGPLRLWSNERGDSRSRLIVCCQMESPAVIDAAPRMAGIGIEVLTPEQVVEQFAGKKFQDQEGS
jgi:hypothetical protein